MASISDMSRSKGKRKAPALLKHRGTAKVTTEKTSTVVEHADGRRSVVVRPATIRTSLKIEDS